MKMSWGAFPGLPQGRTGQPDAALGAGMPWPAGLTARRSPAGAKHRYGTGFAARITGRIDITYRQRCRPEDFVVGLFRGLLQPFVIRCPEAHVAQDHVFPSRPGLS